MEEVVYDRESGQLLTASFMEYAMPRADTLPDLVIGSNPVPTALNPLGAKGAGEAGTVGRAPGGDERRHRRAGSARRPAPRHAGDTGARLAGHPGGPAVALNA